ncbi:hypothetical protein BpHYR1_006476 [Brachionus plicatilis]|uniref:Uncharacterized protein n=1 Tax=Brachionus plicatilis TaxID=10195 RepID=A0A3M7T586_BRAPC|nr:hypothetical protein BpHYR1_006476 [Brachionus plicatilis]
MDSLQREAEQCKDQLKHERETRLIKQAEREAKLGEIEAFNANLIIFQSSVDTFMNSNKSRTTELQQKEKSLNEIINHNDKEKNRLTTELDEAITSYDRMKSDLQANLSNLEKEYSFYTTENDKNLIEINELEPKYKDLCKLYREKCKDYEETRKSVISKTLFLMRVTKNLCFFLDSFLI